MANIATCYLNIECSNPSALLKELYKRGLVGSFDKNLSIDKVCEEAMGDGVYYESEATGLCTGASDCALDVTEDHLGFTGGMKWQFTISNDDVKAIKEAAEAAGVQLKSISGHGWGEVQENLDAYVWPVPKWMKHEWPNAYDDGIVHAYMLTIIKNDEYFVDDEEYDIGYFMDVSADKLLKALQTGENQFSEEWQELFPECFNIDVPISADEYEEGEMFEWDWA